MKTTNSGHYLKTELYELIKSDASIFDFIQESSLDGLWYWDLEHPENEWMNAKFWTTLGYNPDEMPHESGAWKNIINEDDLSVALDNFQKHCADEQHPYDQIVRYKHKDGSTVWIHCKGIAIRNNEGTPIRMLGAHHDVTKLKKAELESNVVRVELEKRDNYFDQLIKNAPITLFEYQIQPSGEIKVLYISPGCIEMFELSPESILENSACFFNTVHPDDISRLIVEPSLDAFSENVVTTEFRIITPSGKNKWLLAQTRISATEIKESKVWVGSIQDITDKKKHEEALLKALTFNKNLLDTSNAIIVGLDNNGKVVHFNPAAEKLTGYSLQELEDKNWFEVLVPKDKYPYVWDEFNRLMGGGLARNFENPILAKDGSEHYIMWQNNEIKDGDKVSGVISFGIDATDLKRKNTELLQAKEQAERNERNFRILFDNLPIGLTLSDMNGQIIASNSISEKILGLTQEEQNQRKINGDVWSIIRPDGTLMPEEEYASVRAMKEQIPIYDVEMGVTKSSNEIAWILVNAQPVPDLGIVISYADITEKKKIETELLKAKEQAETNEKTLRLLIENLPVGITLTDLNGRILAVNPASEKTLGISAEEHKKRTISGQEWTVYRPDGTIMPAEEFAGIRAIKEQKPILNVEMGVLKQDNEIAWISANALPVKDLGLLISYTDFTEKKTFEQELKRAKEKAEANDRLKTAFIQNMSHEIRTPLNAICGFSEILLKPDITAEKQRNFLSIINNSAHQLGAIVNNILTISTLETHNERVNIDMVCINDLILELLSIFKQQANSQNIAVYSKQGLKSKESVIFTDKIKLTQILSNLITNSLKFTFEGYVEFGYFLQNNKMVFFVKDTGIGIKPEIQHKIFERFTQADDTINKNYGGTGLGLSISKGFVELLGGEIWYESAVNQGTTFYFALPYKPVNEPTVSTNKDLSDNAKTILVVEDEEYNFLYIEELLMDMNYQIIHAKNGKEAIELVNKTDGIDFILMDYKMPLMLGDEAASAIKLTHPLIPIVVQSAFSLVENRAKFDGIFDDYLTKPVSEMDLKNMVNKYLKSEN